MIERLNEIGRFMELNVEKTKVMQISGQPSPTQIMIDRKKKAGECGMFQLQLGSVVTNDARCTHENNPRLPLQKHHSTRKRRFSQVNWN
jgi:hypothetical protein